jgi:putative autotransporter adhesin-like protein
MSEKAFEVAAFTGLEVSDHFAVRVKLGAPQSVIVRVPNDLDDAVDVGVRDGALHVGLRPRVDRLGDVELHAEVTAPSIDRVTAGGASSVEFASTVAGGRLGMMVSGASTVTADIDVASTHLTLSGASIATLSGTASAAEANISGASCLFGDGLAVTDLTIDVSGASTADVRATGSLAAGASGASLVRYAGSPRVERSSTSGASSIAQRPSG